MLVVHLKWESSEHDAFIKFSCLPFSMRKLGALGLAPCAHSSVPKASASHKKDSPVMWLGSRTAALPMVLVFLPHPLGGGEGPGSTVWRRETNTESVWHQKRETSASHLYGKFPAILEIGMESPSQSTLAPLRLTACVQTLQGIVGFNPE